MCNLKESDIHIQNINHMCSNMHDTILHSYPNVVGIGRGFQITNGITTDVPTLSFFVTNKIPSCQLSPSNIIPSYINEIKTDVVETGVIEAHTLLVNPSIYEGSSANSQVTSTPNNTAKYRPVLGGISSAVIDLQGAGTLGCAVKDASNIYLLSNNHVFANTNKSKIGASIYQPSYYEGGSSTTPIAKLYNYSKLLFGSGTKYPVNRIDAAIGYVGKRSDANINKLVVGGVLSLGSITGVTTALTIGKSVMKVGRTTGYTTGSIIALNASVTVSYSATESALFTGQIIASGMSSPGDSGSIGLDLNKNAFGLLFAGSSSITVFNPIAEVLSAFNVSIL